MTNPCAIISVPNHVVDYSLRCLSLFLFLWRLWAITSSRGWFIEYAQLYRSAPTHQHTNTCFGLNDWVCGRVSVCLSEYGWTCLVNAWIHTHSHIYGLCLSVRRSARVRKCAWVLTFAFSTTLIRLFFVASAVAAGAGTGGGASSRCLVFRLFACLDACRVFQLRPSVLVV